ncbi:radical SAM protein [Elusimicrobiota bacterium]
MMFECEPYQAKNVLYRFNKIDDFYNARYALNPYRGCLVGCRYCYVQEKKHSDSTGLEEEKRHVVQVKINAPYLLKKKLEADIEPAMIAIGDSCDPYSEVEDEYFITKRLLEVLKDYDFPIHIITRFDRVLRDIDLIRQIDQNIFACVTVSIPVVSKDLVSKLEGNSQAVKTRLKMIRCIRKKGVTAGVAISPVIPYISDGHEVEHVLKKAAEVGADYILCRPLVIKDYQRDMFFTWLKEKYPRLVDSYERLYENREWPEKEYHDKFMENLKQKAESFNLKVGLPVDRGIFREYHQEILEIQ